MTTRASAGGTLLGMLVALVIIGILAAVAMPVWSEAVIRMRRGEAQAALQELMQQQERHFTRFNSYVAFSADSDSDYRWWSGRNASSSAYELEGKACDGQEIRDCVQLVAKPGTPNVDSRFRDPQCERLILTSSGLHLATGPSRNCWR
jgi:type IV pilus assembly protein PilE